MMGDIVLILSGFLGTFGFGILFNIKGRRLMVSAAGGLLCCILYVMLGALTKNEVVVYFFVSVAISIYSEIMARVVKTPVTSFITTSLIPLIPGGSLYYTMAYAFESNLPGFAEKGLYTLELAAALAIGIILVSTLFNDFFVKKQE